MGTNPELAKVQEWVADWYGMTAEDCPFSREDIRNICRGPMRQVLLDFLLPRFRTDEQIKVIRSNLFLNDVASHTNKDKEGQGRAGEDNVIPDQYGQQIKELKGSLDKVHEEKGKAVQRIVGHLERMEESKQSSQAGLMKLLSNWEKTEARAQHIRERVVSTSILLQELNNAKHLSTTNVNVANVAQTPSSESSPSSGDPSAALLLAQLKSVYANASDLFDLYFLQNSSGNNSSHSQPANPSPEVQALTTSVAMQTADLAQSGIPPATLEKWAKAEQEASNNQIRNMGVKFSNVMNPLEELQNETEAIYIRLMDTHIGLHMRNREMERKLEELKEKNMNRIQEIILNDPTIIPADFLTLVQKEEKTNELAKCRELVKQLKQIESLAQSNEDEDLLALLCEDGSASLFDGKVSIGGTEILSNPMRASLGSDLNRSISFARQEALEDLTCALLKSFPYSSKQLETTVQQCKNLVLERFPKILSKDNRENDRKLMSGSPESDTAGMSDEIKMKIPKKFIPNHDLLVGSSNSHQQEQSGDDLLSEVFRMQKEYETKKLQSVAMLRERGTFVPCEL